MPAVAPFVPLITGGLEAAGAASAGGQQQAAGNAAAGAYAPYRTLGSFAADQLGQAFGLPQGAGTTGVSVPGFWPGSLQAAAAKMQTSPTAPYAGPSLTAPFVAPTLEQAQQEPGYQFTQSEGQKALQRSAAARGTLLTGGTLKALDEYTTNLANRTYGDVYNRSFNTFETNQANAYNRLMGLANLGLGGTNAATGYQTSGAAAGAAGTIGATNALGAGITGTLNYYQQQQLLKQLQGSSYGYGSGYGPNGSYAGPTQVR